MSEIYTVTGKTVDEAMEKAAALYGGKDKEISYDIISLPKKGFLGLGSKEAVITVTVNDSSDDPLHSIVDEIKGYKTKTASETGYYTGEAEPEKKSAHKAQPAQKTPRKPENSDPVKPEPAKEAKEEKAAKAEPRAQEGRTEAPKKKKPQTQTQTQTQNKNKQQTQKKPVQKAEEKAPEATAAPASKEDADKRYAVSREEMGFATGFVNSVIAGMKLTASAEAQTAPEGAEFVCTEEADVYPAIEIVGDDTGILIGHHGETLDAIQYLVNLALYRRTAGDRGGRESIKITVDIENYRAKREETLRSLARRMASRAVKYKRNVFLEPMNPYERRIIHSELQEYPDVSTHSVGSDVNRKIVITYEGADKQPQKRRNGGGKGGSNRGGRSTASPAHTAEPAVPSTPEAIPLPTLDD